MPKVLCFFAVLTFWTSGFTAPIPATSSSIIISEKPGLFRSPLGFSIDTARTNWKQIRTPRNNEYIATVYRSEEQVDGVQPALTVRVDQVSKNTSLESYTKRWMKDYPRLGFDILAAKKVRVGKEIGFMLDLINRDNEIQLRQILFVKNRDIVNLTCRDHHENFTNTLKSCNEIFRSFTW